MTPEGKTPEGADPALQIHTLLQTLSNEGFLSRLKFKGRVGRKTAQGVAYLYLFDNKTPLLVKISKHLDYFIRHESDVMESVNKLASWCPNYSWSYCSRKMKVNVELYDKEDFSNDPLEIKEDDKFIVQDVIFYEYIKNSITMTSRLDDRHIVATIQSVLAAIVSGQISSDFVHYDLHTDNILMKKCSYDKMYLYKFKERSLLIPSYGYIPVVIDYGSAYVSHLEGKYVYGSMLSTDAGYMNGLFDAFRDPQVFLTGCLKDLEDIDIIKYSSMRRWVIGLFSCFNIDLVNGWDQSEEFSAAGYVAESIKECERSKPLSRYFTRKTLDCVSVLQTLATYPYKDKGNGNIKKSYTSFMREFSKIENEIRSDTYRGYALMTLVDVVREGLLVRNNFISRMMEVTPFYAPPDDVDFATLETSLRKIGEQIGTIYSRVCNDQMGERRQLEKKVSFRNSEEILFKMAELYPLYFNIDTDTDITVVDIYNTKSYPLKLTEDEIASLEDYTQLEMSTYLHNRDYMSSKSCGTGEDSGVSEDS